MNCDTTAIPLLLTVAEAQKLLRLGRGKTYALIPLERNSIGSSGGRHPHPTGCLAAHVLSAAAGFSRLGGENIFCAPAEGGEIV